MECVSMSLYMTHDIFSYLAVNILSAFHILLIQFNFPGSKQLKKKKGQLNKQNDIKSYFMDLITVTASVSFLHFFFMLYSQIDNYDCCVNTAFTSPIALLYSAVSHHYFDKNYC